MAAITEDTGSRDGSEPLPNPKRGCGHLKRGKAYIVGAGFSAGGVLPSWVELDPHVPFREIGTDGAFPRSYKPIDGLTLQLALEDVTEFVEHYPDELHDDYDREGLLRDARENHVSAGVFPNLRSVPLKQADRHIGRVRERGTEGGEHWGEIPVAEASDLLMRAGKSYYAEPEDYVVESIRHGLSKAIPISEGNIPDVVGGVTRVWIMHPEACAGYGGGLIGFAYAQEVTFTEPEDGDVPTYVEEAAETGALTVRDIEPPQEPPEVPEDQTSVEDWKKGEAAEDGEEDDGGD